MVKISKNKRKVRKSICRDPEEDQEAEDLAAEDPAEAAVSAGVDPAEAALAADRAPEDLEVDLITDLREVRIGDFISVPVSATTATDRVITAEAVASAVCSGC